jgi:hypothetical protein
VTDHSTDRLAELRRDQIKECLERIRELAHTPGLARDEALGQVLYETQTDMWEQEVVRDYCVQNFGTTTQDLIEVAGKIHWVRVCAQPEHAVACLYQATASGVTAPLTGALRAALKPLWAQYTARFHRHPLSDLTYWNWGVLYGLGKAAWPTYALGDANSTGDRTYIPGTYEARWQTADLVFNVNNRGLIRAAVKPAALRAWQRAATGGWREPSSEFDELIFLERRGLGWLSAHLELAKGPWERYIAAGGLKQRKVMRPYLL